MKQVTEEHLKAIDERLKEFSSKASSIIQKNTEAAGTLKMIDAVLHEIEDHTNSDMLWALRNVIRNIESAVEDAADISEIIEEIQNV